MQFIHSCTNIVEESEMDSSMIFDESLPVSTVLTLYGMDLLMREHSGRSEFSSQRSSEEGLISVLRDAAIRGSGWFRGDVGFLSVFSEPMKNPIHRPASLRRYALTELTA